MGTSTSLPTVNTGVGADQVVAAVLRLVNT